MTTFKKKTKKPTRRKNPIERVTLIRPKDKLVDERGRVFEAIKAINKDQVFVKDAAGNVIPVNIKNIDFYDPKKSISQPFSSGSAVADLFAKHSKDVIPVYVEFWNWVFKDPRNSKLKFEIMIDHKLNASRIPVSGYNYGIDLVNQEGKRVDFLYSEKRENFNGYNDIETAIRGVKAIMPVRFGIHLPTDLKLTEHKVVRL